MNSPSAPPSKSAFVLSLPASLAIAEVVERANTAGITISPKYVSNIRAEARARAERKRASRAGAGSSKSAPRSSGAAGAKSAFVRAQPRSMSAGDVVAAAKKAGLSLTPQLVYRTRGRAIAKASSAPAQPTRPRVSTAAPTKPLSRPTTFRSELHAMVRTAADHFGHVLERRLVELIAGEAPRGPLAPPETRRAPTTTARPLQRPTAAPKPSAKRVRTRPASTKSVAPQPSSRPAPLDDHSYRPRILAALDAEPKGMSRSQLIRALELKPSEEGRFGTALVALRGLSAIVLEGTRKQAVYRRAASTAP